MFTSPAPRRVLSVAALFGGVALAAAGCSSSSNGNPVAVTSSAGGSSAVTSAPAGTATPGAGAADSSTGMAGGSSSSSNAGSTGGTSSAVCTDLTNLVTLSSKIGQTASASGGAAAHFAELKSLYNQMAGIADKVKSDAPASLSADAATFDSAINTLNDAVKQASSNAEIQSKADSDPKLKAATSDLSSSVSKLITWKSTNCK